MTFEHGRISTWRLPRFSAFEMDLRQSARTCGEKGEGSVPVAALVTCVYCTACSAAAPGLQLCRAAATGAAAAGLQPLTGPRGPAGEQRNSRELPPAQPRSLLQSAVHEWCGDGVIGRLGPAAAAFCRLFELQRAPLLIRRTPSPRLKISTQWRTLIRTMIAREPCVGSGAP